MPFDVTTLPGAKTFLRNRWWQFVFTLLALAGYLLSILSGILGTPVGSHNFAIVFVWILWWASLILFVIPFLGRGWCSICPIPAPGEWLQRGSLFKPLVRYRFRKLHRWPKRWRNMWLQNGAFVLLALFSIVILTQPVVTSLVLLTLLLIAVWVSLIYERRALCRYLCPVGGFIGLYAQLSPLGLRVKDPSVCAAHAEKSCYVGNSKGYGCPWMVFPGSLKVNTYCGLCLECLRTCPLDNISIYIRKPGDDLDRVGVGRIDEAYKAFIMLGSALMYALILLGPWGGLKSAAYSVGTLPWFGYAFGFLFVVLLGLPGLFAFAVWMGRHMSKTFYDMKMMFSTYAYSLIPLGLAAWMAFTFSFAFANVSYIWGVIADPLGIGWNLLNLADRGWQPYFTHITPYLEILVLMVGLFWSARLVLCMARERLPAALAVRQALPIVGFCMFYVLMILEALVL